MVKQYMTNSLLQTEALLKVEDMYKSDGKAVHDPRCTSMPRHRTKSYLWVMSPTRDGAQL